MKVTIEATDSSEITPLIKAIDFRAALFHISYNLRNRTKHKKEFQADCFEIISEEIQIILEEHNITETDLNN